MAIRVFAKRTKKRYCRTWQKNRNRQRRRTRTVLCPKRFKGLPHDQERLTNGVTYAAATWHVGFDKSKAMHQYFYSKKIDQTQYNQVFLSVLGFRNVAFVSSSNCFGQRMMIFSSAWPVSNFSRHIVSTWAFAREKRLSMMMTNIMNDRSVQLFLNPLIIILPKQSLDQQRDVVQILSWEQVHHHQCWSTATLVQVVSVSCHRWRLAGDISHKPLRLRCAPHYIHRWRRSRALDTQALEQFPLAQTPYIA